MIWVALEDANSHAVTEFVQANEDQVVDLMDVHKVDEHDATKFQRRGTENGKGVVYCGVTYKGARGYNILAAKKYREV